MTVFCVSCNGYISPQPTASSNCNNPEGTIINSSKCCLCLGAVPIAPNTDSIVDLHNFLVWLQRRPALTDRSD